MASKITFEMDKGWKKFAKAVDKKKFGGMIRKHVALETRRNAQRAAKAIRKRIQGGEGAPNAPLTIFIKHSSKPLVDDGDLFKAITFQIATWDEGWAGILRSDAEFGLAEFLHEGGTIKVTNKMRALFQIIWETSMGADPSKLRGRAAELWARQPGGWLPLKKSTTQIEVPGRPFIQRVFEDDEFIRLMKENWEKALARAFKEASGN